MIEQSFIALDLVKAGHRWALLEEDQGVESLLRPRWGGFIWLTGWCTVIFAGSIGVVLDGLLEEFVQSLMVHFPLLLGRESFASRVFLRVTQGSLGFSRLWFHLGGRKVLEHCDHCPAW